MYRGQSYLINDQKQFNKIIDELKGDLTWNQYSDICGVPSRTIMAYRAGTRKPTSHSLCKMTDILPREQRNDIFNKLLGCCAINNPYSDREKASTEDIVEENKEHRKDQFRRMALKGLYGAICLQACVDYRKALDMPFGPDRDDIIAECIEFFKSPIFKHTSGVSDIRRITACIARTQPNQIKYIWRKTETHNKQRKARSPESYFRPRGVDGRFAKNTRPIIEG